MELSFIGAGANAVKPVLASEHFPIVDKAWCRRH